MGVQITQSTALAILQAQRRDEPRVFALGAIARLNAKRTGRPSCDAWVDYAVAQWRAFLNEQRLADKLTS